MFGSIFSWLFLLSYLSHCHVSAQPTMVDGIRDDDRDRQVALLEQTLTVLQSVNSHLQSMDRRLRSVEQREEVKTEQCEIDHQNGTRCRWSKDGRRSCYKVFTERKTWSESRASCQSLLGGADLVSIESHAEDLFLVYMTQELQVNYHHFFTSGRKDTSGRWIWRATGQPFGYTGWGPGEPNNHVPREDACCFANNIMYKGENRRTVYWNDVLNSNKHGYICEFY